MPTGGMGWGADVEGVLPRYINLELTYLGPDNRKKHIGNTARRQKR